MSKIGLKEALQNLQEIFPAVDQQIIKTVLYKCDGHMEKTVEVLIALQEDQKKKNEMMTRNTVNKNKNNGILPHNLPDDFLNYNLEDNVINNNNVSNLNYDDSKYAMELQKKEYLKENTIQNNPKVTKNNIQKNEEEDEDSEEESITNKLSKFSDFAMNKLKNFHSKYILKENKQEKK
jgi:hypothetical protein